MADRKVNALLLQTQALSVGAWYPYWAFQAFLLYALIDMIVLDPAQAVC